MSRLQLTRDQILAFRRRVGVLDERLPSGPDALRTAAWAGLQDSMPRAALLSIHARIEGATPTSWEDPSLVQVWGPRFSVYVIPARDVALFTVARYPEDARGRRVAEEMASGMASVLGDRRLPDREVARALGVGNRIRYAATTGTILIRWEGARAPTIWTAPRPDARPPEARLELARRYVHVFGPTTDAAFATWAGISAAQGRAAFEGLAGELTAVTTPIGDAWILSSDEATMRAAANPSAPARLLPSGDTFFLCWGADRTLLVPAPGQRAELWTSRVWPGALLVAGEIVGTWRRANENVAVSPWRTLTQGERAAVEAEAASLPLRGLERAISVRWLA
jgi:Winged helix DNA-binding domain